MLLTLKVETILMYNAAWKGATVLLYFDEALLRNYLVITLSLSEDNSKV